MAVRFDCTIYVEEGILNEIGVEADPNEEQETLAEEQVKKEKPAAASFHTMTVAELQIQLKQALDSEDYELAARVRDELNKRK